MYVILNLMHLASQISRSLHLNDLLLDIDYSFTSCKCILDDTMSIRSKPRKVGHDLDLKIFTLSGISYYKMYVVMNLMHLACQISRS